jgi:hypothetical protein
MPKHNVGKNGNSNDRGISPIKKPQHFDKSPNKYQNGDIAKHSKDAKVFWDTYDN